MSKHQMSDKLRDSRHLNQIGSFEMVAAMCEEAADELDRMHAELEQYGRTKDGVLAKPGMTIYRIVASVSGASYIMPVENIGWAGDTGDYYDPTAVNPSDGYSTSAAAEAARATQ